MALIEKFTLPKALKITRGDDSIIQIDDQSC